MALTTAAQARTSFDLKSASLPVVAVLLKTTDAAQFAADLAERVADAPGFFDNDPVLIDLAPVRESEDTIDFVAIVAELRRHSALLRAGNHRDLSAHIGQHARGQRAGADAFEFDDADAGEGGRQRRAHVPSLRAIKSFMISVVPP